MPFVGPETQERNRGRPFRARIGANESVFGPSPKAIEAMEKAAAEAWKYCDPENYDLKQALAAHHGVAPANIVVGEGIDGLFAYVVRLFVEPGVTVATSLGAYPTFNFHVHGYGGRLGHNALRRRPRGPAIAPRSGRAREGAPHLLRQPRQPHGLVVGRGEQCRA